MHYLKQGINNQYDLSRRTVKLLARKSNITASVPDDRYAVSNGSGYAVLISWDEYVILERKLDTPYPMDWIRRIQLSTRTV
ncbi:hypothetical protein Tco_1137599, partial [Tanacetum coccineum]